MSTDIVAKLDELADLQAAERLTRLDYEARRADILNAVQPQLDDLDREIKPRLAVAELQAAQLEGQIKVLVIGAGESVKGARLHAVYSKGRVTWDGKKLDGMMSLIPQLADARKEGEPSVTIRAVK
jgi:hypothetical protein